MLSEEEGVVCVGETSLSLSRLHSLLFIKISSYVCIKLSVEVRTTLVSVDILPVLSDSEVWKNKLYLSFT